jgi:hypothetical protein
MSPPPLHRSGFKPDAKAQFGFSFIRISGTILFAGAFTTAFTTIPSVNGDFIQSV